jgi:hypothetical protein
VSLRGLFQGELYLYLLTSKVTLQVRSDLCHYFLLLTRYTEECCYPERAGYKVAALLYLTSVTLNREQMKSGTTVSQAGYSPANLGAYFLELMCEMHRQLGSTALQVGRSRVRFPIRF